MLEKQSCDEFLANIEKGKSLVVSLSPESRASLAVHYGISPVQVFKKLTTFFKSLGVKAVFDTSCSRDLALIEACNEFISRYRDAHSLDGRKSSTSLPMLSPACPGWICYAEKQLGSYILPYVSSVKSPQQAIGATIKHHPCQALGLRPEEVYHVTVMPCYDKKLEAARDDFVFQGKSEGGFDAGEDLMLTELKEVDFKDLEESSLDRMLTNLNEEGDLYGVSGSSGGYAETIFRHAAKVLFGQDISGPLQFKTLRNSDIREMTLEFA